MSPRNEFEVNYAAYQADIFHTLFSKVNHLPKEYCDDDYQRYIKAVAQLICDDRLEIHLGHPPSTPSDNPEIGYYLSPEIRYLIYMENILTEVAYKGIEFNANNAVPSPYGIRGECHAMTAFHWVLNQDCTICSGISDKINAHSWLISPAETIIEPTPIPRETYYGIIIKDPVAFVREEFDRIKSMFDDPHYEVIHCHKERFLDEYYAL